MSLTQKTMAHKSKIVINETAEELKRIYLSAKNSKNKLKVKTLMLVKENKFDKQEKIAIYLGVSCSTIKRWLKEYHENGISFLLLSKTKGKPKCILNEEIVRVLHKRIYDTATPFKSYSEVQNWIFDEFGVAVKYATLRNYLIMHFGTKVKITKSKKYVTASKKFLLNDSQ